MRTSLIYILLLTLVAGACFTEEQNNPLIIPTCYDGIQNQDEEDVDCGGRCAACIIIPPIVTPCAATLHDNMISVDDTEQPLDDVSCTENATGYTLFATREYAEVTIKLKGPLPTEDKIYPIVPYYDQEDGQATVELMSYYQGPYRAYEGELYVRVKDGKITVEFCTLDMAYTNFGYTFYRTFFGRISCQ